jgi:phosphatidylglycerophosphate synthase
MFGGDHWELELTTLLVAVGGMDGTQPAALFDRAEGTVLAALVAQLREVVPDGRVSVLAPEWTAESIRGQLPASVSVTACRTIRIALDEVVRHAYEALAKGDEVSLIDGGIVAHNEALAVVLTEPTSGTALLVGEHNGSSGVRTAEDIVVSAGSSVHAVTDPDRDGLGVLRVAQTDLGTLAEAARGISGMGRMSDTASDLVDLVTVGLVRLGTRVRAVPVDPYVLVRPHTQLEVGAALVDLREVDEDRLRLVSSGRPDDGLYATLVGRRLARIVTRWAVRSGIGANQVTLGSLAVALLAAVSFATGARVGLIAGALVLQISYVLGCADGEIARYTRRTTPFGGWFDAVSERVKEYAVYAGLCIGAVQAGDRVWTLAAAMLAVQAYRQMVDAGFAVRSAEWRAEETPEPLTLPINLRDDVPATADVEPSASATSRSHGSSGSTGSHRAAGSSFPRGAVDLLDTTNRVPALVWVKRTLTMPVGERWLVISIVAALYGPREVFLALLAVTTVAALYMTVGRMLRSIAHA